MARSVISQWVYPKGTSRTAGFGTRICRLANPVANAAMKNRPSAFLLHGFLGAGKTTFAKRLKQEHHAIRFTPDEWMSRLYGDDPPEAFFSDYSRRISEIMESTWSRFVEVGTSVILDFGFWSRAERNRIRGLVNLRGGDALLYHLSCSDDEAWHRITERNERLSGSLYIAPNTFQLLKARFEPLGLDEQRVEVASE